jgi:hypothetical protein
MQQVALGFLPYVPRVGEHISLIARDLETNLWSVGYHFRVERVSYEMFGNLTLPRLKTGEFFFPPSNLPAILANSE